MLTGVSFVAVFALFLFVAFPVFRNGAHDPTPDEREALKPFFLALYATMLASALAVPGLVAWYRGLSWPIALLLLAPLWGLIGFFSFFLLEFQNACEIGDALFVDSRC